MATSSNSKDTAGFAPLDDIGGQGPIESTDTIRQYELDHPTLTEEERQMKEEELSFYSASENEHGDDNIWGLLSGVGGNIFEW